MELNVNPYYINERFEPIDLKQTEESCRLTG